MVTGFFKKLKNKLFNSSSKFTKNLDEAVKEATETDVEIDDGENSSAETLEKKASFKDLIAKNRCVVISNGFFEWKRGGDSKIPYYIHHSDGKIIAMAGLCKWDKDLDGNRKLV